jgi:chromosome segregation ATPase
VPDIESLLTGGGAAGVIIAVTYAYQQWQASRREEKAEPRTAISAAVTDAAAANSLLLAALQEERVEVQRLSGEVENLRMSNAKLYEQMRSQRSAYERELSDLRQQLNEVSDRLAGLQSRLRADVPDVD